MFVLYLDLVLNSIFIYKQGKNMKTLPLIMIVAALSTHDAAAQYAATQDAQYLAVIKAVADYKIDDEKEFDNIEKLRQDERFRRKLYKMMQKLNNNKSRDATNQRVFQVLRRAGKEIYDILD